VKQGYAIAFSDFQGLGTPGLHPFLQGEAEARGALDIIRAARQIEPQIGRRYVVMGHSQGGQADLFTAAFGRSYVPELTLLGNVAFAPASNLTGRLEGMTTASEPSLTLTYLIYVLQSFASNHPEIDLKQILTPEALSHLSQTRLECVSKTLSEGYWAKAIPKEQFIPGADLSAVLRLADANDPGVVRIPVPTLIMQGTADVTVDPADTDLLVRKLCNTGVEVAYRAFPGADHETVVKEGNGEAQAWVQARFAGERAASNCHALPSASVRRN
jgi:alpha-beta hydrolase superfamily lysophospholipase